MEFRKKVLVLGQLPKEYGGSYTTGVGNVIVNCLKEYDTKFWVPVLFASNVRLKVDHGMVNFAVYGISWLFILRGLTAWIFHKRKRGSIIRYYKRMGISWKKGLVHEIVLCEILKREGPDIIHVHNSGLYPAIKALNLPIPIILTFHGIFSSDDFSVAENLKRGIDLKKLMEGIARNIPSLITVLTESMKRQAVIELGVANKLLKVIPNGVNENFWYEPKVSLSIRRDLSIEDGCTVFISVGALTRRKNHVAAIDFLNRSQRRFTYLIIGRNGDFSVELKKLVSKEPNVRLINYVENKELYRYYSASDAFILPSTKEGQALVVFEALACGLPIILNEDIFDSIDLPADYDEYVFPVNLSTTLNSINFFELNKDQRKLLSERVVKHLSWKEISKQYLDLYSKAC